MALSVLRHITFKSPKPGVDGRMKLPVGF